MGETFDPETRLRHIAQAAWNAQALLAYELRGIGEDDRHKLPQSLPVEVNLSEPTKPGEILEYDPREYPHPPSVRKLREDQARRKR